MKKNFVLIISLISYITTQGQSYNEDNGLLIEIPKDTLRMERYTSDNQVYVANNEYIFSYEYLDKGGDKKKFKVVNGQWSFQNEVNPKVIENISMIVLPDFGPFKKHQSWYDQTVVQYKLNTFDKSVPSEEATGLVENKKNIWMHPPRMQLFRILELNPFPYIKFPIELGSEWTWSIEVGGFWGDERWIMWDESILNLIKYKVIELDVELNMSFGSLLCTKIEAFAESSLGITFLNSYYNSKYGFVKLEYTNIDGSKITLQLIDIDGINN